MSSRNRNRSRHTLALRLTVWYAGIFAVTSLLAFALVYAFMVTLVHLQMDADLAEDLEEFAYLVDSSGIDRVASEIEREVQGNSPSDIFFRLWRIDGSELLVTDLSSWSGLPDGLEVLGSVGDSDEPVLETLSLPGRAYHARTIAGRISPELVIQIGESLEDAEEFLEVLLLGFVVVLGAVFVLGGPVGLFMAKRALRGLNEVTRTASEIADGALHRRVAVGSWGSELDRLAQTFNDMLDRIQALILGMRDMTDNLAHDLRSPVARIRASAEMALAGAGSGIEWETLALDTTEECDRLLEMINTTLDIAEAESGAASLRISRVDLVDVVVNACDLFQTVADDKNISVVADLPQDCRIQGDLQRLQRVVANLLDNALKYTPPGGKVSLKIVDDGEQVKLLVADSGVGISAEELPRIFRRFFRCDWSRSQWGNGLGLSLALAFVRAHGGDISVSSVRGEGSVFTVILPRSKPDL